MCRKSLSIIIATIILIVLKLQYSAISVEHTQNVNNNSNIVHCTSTGEIINQNNRTQYSIGCDNECMKSNPKNLNTNAILEEIKKKNTQISIIRSQIESLQSKLNREKQRSVLNSQLAKLRINKTKLQVTIEKDEELIGIHRRKIDDLRLILSPIEEAIDNDWEEFTRKCHWWFTSINKDKFIEKWFKKRPAEKSVSDIINERLNGTKVRIQEIEAEIIKKQMILVGNPTSIDPNIKLGVIGQIEKLELQMQEIDQNIN